MNRDDLVVLVASYAKRGDLTTEIETMFIPIAESRIGRDLKSAENEVAVQIIEAGGLPIPYPDDYGQLRAIDVAQDGGPKTLLALDLHSINQHNSEQGISGPAEFYTAADSAFIMKPSQNGTFTFYYWSRPSLPTGASENAVLDRWPEVYLYATLAELHRWEVNPDPAAQAAQQYAADVARINRDAARALGDKPAMRRA